MIRLVLPVPKSTENMLEKARPGLIFRTDLPYHTAKGELKYRKGWVKPEDARALDQAKKQHDPSAVIGKYQYEADMFDEGEGDPWEAAQPAEAKKPEPAPMEEKKTEPWMVSAEPEKSKGHIGFFGAGDRKRELLAYSNGEIYIAHLDDVVDVNTGNRIGRWEGPAWQKDDIMARFGITPEKAAPKAPLYIEDLTERAIIVRGDTRTHKEKIKEAGGKWNGKHGGWIFPKKWEEKVRGQLGTLLGGGKSEKKEEKPKPQQGGGIDNIAMKNGWDAWVDQPLEVLQETKEKYQGRKDYGEFMAFLEKLIADKATNVQNGATINSTAKPDKLHGNDTDRAIASRGGQVVDGKKPQPSRVADRIAKPEIADGEEAKTGDVQADLEKPISKMKFRDYGSWNAAGKHLSPTKRAALNQQIAELLLLPSDEIEPKELALIRQYSGFGGTKVEDERGVLYDYFTSPPVARMVWKLANKIVPLKSGTRALEPSCGGGVFFDVAPQGVDLTGVEYDSRTAAVASLLQPQARIYHSSFEQFNLHQREKFDVVVGNAPFGDRSVSTSFLDEPGEKSLDRYFISRSLDNLKGGGPMALIVGPGVMDNVSGREWRAKMLRKGQFIGAMRLPNQSFKHTQTGVSPDIVMFRAYSEKVKTKLAAFSDEELKNAGFWDDAWVEGTYYEEMPRHRLGRIERGQFDSEITVGSLEPEDMDRALESFEPRPMRGEEDFARLQSAESVPGDNVGKMQEKLSEQEAAAVAEKTLRVGMTKTVDGKIYRLNDNHRWELAEGANEAQSVKIDRVKEISETVLAIREAMRGDEPVDDLQRQARSLIEAYARDFGVKHSEDKDIQRFVKANPSVSGVYEAMTVELESDLLTKQNVYSKEIEIIDGHRPAIKALLDMGRNLVPGTVNAIKARFHNDAEGLIEAMWTDPDIFVDESGVFHLREDFISGNAWQKIDALEKAIQEHSGDEWERNREKWKAGADALRDAVGWVPIEDADVFPQASWIPEYLVNLWAENGMERPAPNGFVYARNEEGKWGIVAERDVQGNYDWKRREYNYTTEGEWIEHNDELIYFLNSQKQRSKYTDTETYNKNAVENFKTWLATNEAERKEVEEIYNRQFNTELGVPTKTYSVNLDGWNSEIEIKPWQWQSIHHLYRQGKGISALGTGFGKTYAAIALYALLRQEGKIKRALFQVPNNKVKDWVKYFGKALPGIKVGSVDPEAKGYGNQATRFGWYQTLASGDYDVIILPESSASEIQLNAENDEAIVGDIASQVTAGKGKTERKKEEAKATAEGKLTGGKKNLTITFEEFGCDSIFADEMHRQKNLWSSSLSRETGMNDGRRSDRALSFFKKCELIRRQNGGKNVFGLTATPLTNSPLEYYNMMQHIAPEELAAKGIANIDDFIHNFADIEEGQKYDSFSGQLKPGKVLVGFKNLRSLQDMFFKYTDLQNDPSKIGLKKPTPTNRPNILPAQKDQTEVVKSIAARVEAYRSMTKEEREGLRENFLTYYSQMRTASLDLELYDPAQYKGWKNPKIEKMAESAWETYNARGGGQVIFCDRVVSGDRSLNFHDKIKKSLVAKGFKESEIVVVNGLTKSGSLASDQALEKMVSDAIDGFNGKWEDGKLVVPPKYKIIIGTTQTIGEGVNLQKNSSALHHLDIPYRPSDFIQRNGRVDRQGNKQETVELHTYATAGTIDNYSMALVAGKENWINQLLRTKSNVFTNPNGDGMDMDEILLSLTEEWGDKATADEKRKAIADKKATAIKTENQKKAHDYLKQLSLMRGALSTYNGDKGSREYQNRLRKIDNIEAGLSNNPEFRNPEILGETPPEFIYDEGRRRVIFKGDLVIRDGHISRVAGFNYKKREYNLRSVIAGEKETAVPAYASSNVSRWGGDKDDPTIIVTNPTPAEVERYIAMADYKGFYGKPLEFKRDNYEDFVKIHGSRYNQDAMYLFEKKDGTIASSRGSSYFDHEILNPYSDAGRGKIRAALKSGKMSPSDYRTLEEHFGDLGSKDILRTAAIKRFNEEIHAKPIMAALSAQKPDSEGRVDMAVMVDALRDKGIDEYSIRRTLRLHPDFDIGYDYVGEEDNKRFTTVIRRKQGVEKSLGYSNIIAKGGRVYVLLPGRR